jgi:hypothetical protein
MKKKLLVLLAVLILSLTLVIPAAAITHGEPDGIGHPYVGMMITEDIYGDFWGCSGTLLSPTVFLTAGHCAYEQIQAWVTFDTAPQRNDRPLLVWLNSGEFITGTPFAHPEYGWAFPNTSDVGVVILDQPVVLPTYGALPELGFLDDLSTRRGLKELMFTTVGYGIQEILPRFQSDDVRYVATSKLVNLRSALTGGFNLHTSNNPGKGNGSGGACFGDSGGPVFYGDGESNVIAGIVSFGLNYNCKGADFAYRADIANTQDWVNGFLP